MRAPRRRRARRSGATAVETAVVLPVFLLIVLGLIEVAQMGMAYQVLGAAAREGCRVAIIGEKTGTDVRASVDARLKGSGLSVAAVTVSPASWQTAPKGTPITVSLAVPFRQVSWLAEPLHLDKTTIHASATFSSERP